MPQDEQPPHIVELAKHLERERAKDQDELARKLRDKLGTVQPLEKLADDAARRDALDRRLEQLR